ncbi:HvfC/BufC N-terminal domain-containing protein [Paracoccus albus]|uniref:HvfC/BufC N-terminal domain-containing protein n=1 Tax=Paracoccus albus TaxID=3017784 RepID=UPI0022F120DF|nr:DNA-binding domain-containing protein [Paracoccus albus]WBU60916.1 DNA-binding domain-containing protein [Paracoccus albus]
MHHFAAKGCSVTPFVDALRSPLPAVPKGIELPQGGNASRRFAIYRNNVNVALSRALADNFPVVTSLVGKDFMMAAARIFTAAHPPATPILANWGAAFPVWLSGFPPAARLEYLPDIARLEQLCRCSVNARDAVPVAAQDVAAMSRAELARWRPSLHPSLRFMSSGWPLLRIRNHALSLKTGQPRETGEILITRPALTLMLRPAPTGTVTALTRISNGADIDSALDGLEERAAILTCLLRHHAFEEVP